MNIRREHKNYVPFIELPVGATFTDLNGSVYIKTEDFYSGNDTVDINATSLATGSLYCFRPSYEVTPVKCELVVKD